MNKVVNIEIAGQVFWIDEQAYDVLQSYLQTIQQQLSHDECKTEIYDDIELRIAELIFNQIQQGKKAITTAQVTDVINQVGYIDADDCDVREDVEQPKLSYRDTENKILAGVCGGLAMRIGVPAFILRIAFIALTFLFGVGVVLYLIFWLSLDNNANRVAALAAQGKPQTAKLIATFESPKVPPMIQLQRIIFLPFSLLGLLISTITNHFAKRRTLYGFVLKNIIVLGLAVIALIACSLILEFNQSRLFTRPIALLISASLIYIIVLFLAIYMREFYLTRPKFKINRQLKLGAIAPCLIIITSFIYININHLERSSEVANKSFQLTTPSLTLTFADHALMNYNNNLANIKLLVSDSLTDEVNIRVSYLSDGASILDAKNNIRAIEYFYSFADNSLEFNQFWLLKDNALRRGQRVEVSIEIPQNITIISNINFTVAQNESPFIYTLNEKSTVPQNYLSQGQFLYNTSDEFKLKASNNEKDVLALMFCNQYFFGESWHCQQNIVQDVANNNRFDKAFQRHAETINKMRELLAPNRRVLVNNLVELQSLVKESSNNSTVKSNFHQYIDQLVTIKTNTSVIHPPESG